jgi:hypothetical protein
MPYYANRSFTCNGTPYAPGQVMKLADIKVLQILEPMIFNGEIVTDEDLRSKGWLEHRAREADVHLARFKLQYPEVFAPKQAPAPVPVKKAAPAKKTAPASKAE